MEYNVNIFKKEIIILKIKQKAQIQGKSQGKTNMPHPSAVKGFQQITDQIISQNTGNDDSKIIDIKISVKPQGHACQKQFGRLVGFHMIQDIPAKQCDRQKNKYKNIGIKKHLCSPSVYILTYFHIFCLIHGNT